MSNDQTGPAAEPTKKPAAAPKAAKKAKEEKEVKMVTLIYNKSNIITFQLDATQPLHKLTPGTNHIPSDIFELMKADKILNGKIESGLIDVISDDSEGGTPAEIYEGLKPKAKRDIITNEVSVENLNSYLEVETNADLKKLIEERVVVVGAETQYRS